MNKYSRSTPKEKPDSKKKTLGLPHFYLPGIGGKDMSMILREKKGASQLLSCFHTVFQRKRDVNDFARNNQDLASSCCPFLTCFEGKEKLNPEIACAQNC